MLGSGGIEHPAAALRSAQSRSRPVRRQQRQRSRAGSLPNVDRRIRRKICPGAVRTFRHKVAAQYFSDRSVRKSLCRPGPDGSDGRESGIYASRLRSAAADTMRPIGKRAATVMSRSACNTATTRPATHAPRVLPAGTRKNRPSTGVTAGKPSGVPTGKS